MAVLSAQDIQQIVIDELGDTDDGLLARRATLYWNSYADKAATAPRLQEAYFRRRCCDVLLATLRQTVDISEGGLSIKDSDRFAHVQALRQAADAEITKLERWAQQQQRKPQGGRIAQPAPLSVADEIAAEAADLGAPLDANDPTLSGSPYRGRTGVVRWP